MAAAIEIDRREDGDRQTIYVIHEGMAWVTKSAEPFPSDEEIKGQFFQRDLRKKYFDKFYG